MPEVQGVKEVALNPEHAQAAAEIVKIAQKFTSKPVEYQVVVAMATAYMCACFDWETEAVTRTMARNMRAAHNNPELMNEIIAIIHSQVSNKIISVPSQAQVDKIMAEKQGESVN